MIFLLHISLVYYIIFIYLLFVCLFACLLYGNIHKNEKYIQVIWKTTRLPSMTAISVQKMTPQKSMISDTQAHVDTAVVGRTEIGACYWV